MSTFGVGDVTPCAEKAMLKGISIGFSPSHLAEMMLRALLMILAGLTLPRWPALTLSSLLLSLRSSVGCDLFLL